MLELNQVSFSFRKGQPVLSDLSLSVPEKAIYGFLGANGAGKSTTIRTILGLLKPQKGTISFRGIPLSESQNHLLENSGNLIEAPSLYGHLTAKENLEIVRQIRKLPDGCVEQALETVKLSDTRLKKVREFSMGMKQRLGLAIALIGNPELLILDEPTNGLDPVGTLEIRNLILELSNQGKTIFLSSHLLSEIEKIATVVGIIRSGQLLFQGTVKELREQVNTARTVKITGELTANPDFILPEGIQMISLAGQEWMVSANDDYRISDLIKRMTDSGLRIFSVVPSRADLELLFMTLNESDRAGGN